MLRSENFLLEIFRDCCLLFNFQGSVLFFALSHRLSSIIISFVIQDVNTFFVIFFNIFSQNYCFIHFLPYLVFLLLNIQNMPFIFCRKK